VRDLEAQVLAEIRRIAAAELQLAGEVEPGQHLVRDLKLDSVGALTLAVALEDRFQVLLADRDAAAVETVGDLARLVARRIGERAP
jgi:acyl carrier protein